MKTLSEIQAEVGEWSLVNFGAQQSKANPRLQLDSLAPLLGIMEEIGEYQSARNSPNSNTPAGDKAEMEDSIGDILIYLCDFASRETACGIIAMTSPPLRDETLSILGGRLCHCALKRHQGIRGMDALSTYVHARNMVIDSLMRVLHNICETEVDKPLIDILNETWEKVQQRNWKENPGDGTNESNT